MPLISKKVSYLQQKALMLELDSNFHRSRMCKQQPQMHMNKIRFLTVVMILLTVNAVPIATAASGADVIVTQLSYANGIFTSMVKNQGTAATPAGVSIGVGYSVDGVQRTWGAVTGPLAAGASVTIGTNGGSYTIPTGTHTMMAWVDDINRFAESVETNNQLSQSAPNNFPVGANYHFPSGANSAKRLDGAGLCRCRRSNRRRWWVGYCCHQFE